MSDKYQVSNKLPAKQVSILGHRRKRILQQTNKQKQKSLEIRNLFRRRPGNFHKAEKYIFEYLKAERDDKRIKRAVCSEGLYVKTPRNIQMVVVMRHRAKIVSSETVKQAFKELNLHFVGCVKLLRMTPHVRTLLKILEPYIVWGYPNIHTIRELIFKHGFFDVNKVKTAITSNTLIEEKLGHFGIICIEDIVHHIFTVGENFDEVLQIIKPFAMKRPIDGWKNKITVSVEKGGEFGNRKHDINEILANCM